MKRLNAETVYLQGARDILLQLIDDYDMYLIPSEKLYSKTEADKYEYFPVMNITKRKLVGEAVLDLLINDRKSLSRFLLQDYDGLRVTSVKRDKNGKITQFKIELKDNNDDTDTTMV